MAGQGLYRAREREELCRVVGGFHRRFYHLRYVWICLIHLITGSENNSVYVYYKHMTTPLASYRFGNPIDTMTGQVSAEEDPNQFVSNVCWMRNRPGILVAANSQGRFV